MHLPRVRFTVRRLMVAAVLSIPILVGPGCGLPVDRLRVGMTRAEAKAAVGRPRIESKDGTSWIVTRFGSSDWLEIKSDADGRVESFRTDCF
jgi:hypothetical protein